MRQHFLGSPTCIPHISRWDFPTRGISQQGRVIKGGAGRTPGLHAMALGEVSGRDGGWWPVASSSAPHHALQPSPELEI